MHLHRRLSRAAALALAPLAACGGDPSAPRPGSPRTFAFSHIAGLAPDSGYVCPPRVDGAVARVVAGGEGIELFPGGDLWINVAVGTWERFPSSQQEAHGATYNSVGRWAPRGDSLDFTGLDWPQLPRAVRLAGDSITFPMSAACPTDASQPGALTLVFKEITP